jgi:hypothetical protein
VVFKESNLVIDCVVIHVLNTMYEIDRRYTSVGDISTDVTWNKRDVCALCHVMSCHATI